MATVNSTNGLKWDYKLDQSTTRPDQDFSWAFPPDGTPTPQVKADPTEVTYAAVGTTFGDPTRPTQPTKTATLTVTNVPRTVSNKALASNVATLTTSATHGFKVGQSVVITGMVAPFNGTFTIASTPSGTTFTFPCTGADVTSAASGGTVTSDSAQYPAAGVYTVTVPVATGTGPSAGLLSAGREGGNESSDDIAVGYDPAAHSVAEVQEFVAEHPDEAGAIYDAELAGKARSSLLSWLDSQVPYDPADYSVADVVEYAEANPDQVEDLIAAEEAGKNRSTLIAQLEDLASA
jgi:hypothetical protein